MYIVLREQPFYFIIWVSCYNPLLGCTRSWGMFRAVNQFSHHSKKSRCAVHGEVNGLDIAGQQVWRFFLLCHTHNPQKGSYPICVTMSRNIQHWCRHQQPHPGTFHEGGCWCQRLNTLFCDQSSFLHCGHKTWDFKHCKSFEFLNQLLF